MKFDALLRKHVDIRGHSRELTLRMPRFGEVFNQYLPRRLRTADRMSVLAPAQIKRLVSSLDGVAADIELARAIFNDPALYAQYVAARNDLLETVIESGMLHCLCPHCGQWEAELSPLALAVGLRAAFWPLSEADTQLAVPSTADATWRARAPHVLARSSRQRATLPYATASAGSPVTATFRAVDGEARQQRLRQLQDGIAGQERDEQWSEDLVGFRAALRMAATLESLSAAPVEIASVMQLALGDFLFLDNLHYLLCERDLPEDHGLAISCRSCGKAFLPLA
jgi:hypothetical protein